MLGLEAGLFLLFLALCFAVYTIAYICVSICKRKNELTVNESEEMLYFGGSKYVRNVFFLGVAMSQMFTPGIYKEHLVSSTVTSINIFISRVMAIIVSIFFWNHLAKLNFTTVEQYLFKRFDSKIIEMLHLCNRIVSLFYISFLYFKVIEQYGIFHVRNSLEMCAWLTCFGTFVSIGGMHSVLVGCLISWLLDYAGLAVLFYRAGHYMRDSWRSVRFDLDYCYSTVGPNIFFITIGHVMTVQPGYMLFRAAGSIKKGNIAIGIGLGLLILNTVLTFVCKMGFKHYSIVHNTSIFTSSHHLFGLKHDSVGAFTAINNESSENMMLITSPTYVTMDHFLSIIGPLISGNVAFYILYVQSLTTHCYIHLLPKWLKQGLVSTGREHHLIYSAVSFLIAYLLIVFLVYISFGDISEQAEFYELYSTGMCELLLAPTACILLMSPVFPDLWTVPSVALTVFAALIGVILNQQLRIKSRIVCVGQWYSVIMFSVCFVGLVLLTTVLRNPRCVQSALIFPKHLKLHQHRERSRTPSVSMVNTARAS